MVDGQPLLENAHHHEISLSQRAGDNKLQIAYFRDRIKDPALLGVGDVGWTTEDVLPDVYSGTFSFNGGALEAQGVRLVFQRRISDTVTATWDYAYGGVLELEQPNVDWKVVRSSLQHGWRHSAALRLNGSVPRYKTRWIASYRWTSGGNTEVLALVNERIRRRELRKVVNDGYQAALCTAGVAAEEVCYVASTGEGELVDFRRGHFYGMTTHARGAIFLMPEVRAVLDVGALHARAMRIDERSRVLSYRMTGQCASGSGQFLENVARYLGIALEDVGPLSCRAGDPQVVSSICAVLAETDVINMVSRGITTPDILKGIHLSMAGRYTKLLRAIDAHGQVAITGGLSADTGLAQALQEKSREDGLDLEVRTHPDSIYAGALGAALWGAYRHRMLARHAEVPA